VGTINAAGFASCLPDSATTYYRDWLDAARLSHGADAIRAFALAHRSMFGTRVELVERGYAAWRTLRGAPDSGDAFAEFFGPRYRRWRDAVLGGDAMALLASWRGRSQTLAA
jgi:hypothetical protein